MRNTKEHFKYAVTKSIPVFFGYIFLGIAFGILMSKAGYGPFWTLAASLFIYAGSMQFVLVSFLAAGAPLGLVALTTLFINGRHMFYGLSFVERFRKMGRYYILNLTLYLDSLYLSLIEQILAVIVVELRYFPALYLLLDGEEQKCSPAVRRGISMMYGNYLRLIAFWLFFLPRLFIGLLFLGVGVLVVAPWVQVSLATFYMELKQQEKIRIRSKTEDDIRQGST